MPEIAPLTPLRFDLARSPLASVISPPYDVISEEERKELIARNASNIVRLELPDGEGDAKYANAAATLEEWIKNGTLVRDSEPAFYRYDQSFLPPGGGTQTITRRGFLAAVRLHPFSDRVILPHERTLSGPKEDRLKLLRALRTQVSPGFMLYSDPRGELDSPLETGSVLAEFATTDGVHHVLAKVTARDALVAVVDGLRKSSLLIADGHHRYETSVGFQHELGDGPGTETREHRYFMTFLVNGDDPNLVVFPTHRLIHSLPKFDFDELMEKAHPLFILMKRDDKPTADELLAWLAKEAPTHPAFVVVAKDGRAAMLALKHNVDLATHPTLGPLHPTLRNTDVAVLHSGVLENLLGISQEAQAKKTNIRYPQDARAALADLHAGTGGAQALFLMSATPVSQVRAVAEAGEVMPQKSTFFHPKVPTGLALHTLDPSRPIPRAS